MAVTESFTLPAQPSVRGTATRVPLGGDGFLAPFAMYILENVEIDMDASGGGATINCYMDVEYCSLVDWATVSVHQQTATVNKDIAVDILGLEQAGTAVWQARMDSAEAFFAPEIVTTWAPPGMLLLPGSSRNARLRARTENDVDGDVFELDAQILLFDPNVRQKVPLWQIWRNLSPRTTQQTFKA